MSKELEGVKQSEEELSKGITLVPMGGVPKRIQTIASMIYLAEKYERRLEIIWHIDEEVPVSTDRLFTLVPRLSNVGIKLRVSKRSDHFLNMPAMASNYFVSLPFVSLRYDQVLSPKRVERLLYDDRMALDELLKDGTKSLLIATSESFGNFPNMYDVLEATVEVNNVVLSCMSSWSGKVVGVHIDRRSNPVATYSECPIELFIKRMQEIVEADREVKFFIATTSKDERERLATIFHERVYVPHRVADTETVKGLIQSLGELLALSRCHQIISTPDGSYAQVASEIRHNPIETLSIYANK